MKPTPQEFLGFGLGLRSDHYQQILDTLPAIDWLEIISENFLVDGGKPLYYLDKIREHYPMVMHGVSMSIGSTDPLDKNYLKQLKVLAERVQPKWFSDHLCWTGVDGNNMHDLLPLPYTEEALNHVVERIKQVQDFMNRQMLIENVSSYVSYKDSEMTEWEFLCEVTERADCLLLLDVNNIYVSAFNHHFDPEDYLQAIPLKRVQQIHLAGHSNMGTHIVDTHDNTIIDEVWSLYEAAIRKFGLISTMIERDDNIPALSELLAELNKARDIAESIQSDEKAVCPA